MITITIEYFAELREKSGKQTETIQLQHTDAKALYSSLKQEYDFHSDWQKLGIAINHEMANWDQVLQNGDVIVFIPKVAGG